MPPSSFTADSRVTVNTYGPARLELHSAETPLGKRELPVLHLKGSCEEMGRQYGALAGERIKRQTGRITKLFSDEGISEFLAHLFLDRAWKRLKSHTPESCLREMAMVVEGAREKGIDLSLKDIERITTATNLDMYKREERFLEIIAPKALAPVARKLSALLIPQQEAPAMSCTMFAAWGSRTVDGKCFAIRNLDWLSQTGMHIDRLMTLYEPENRNAFVSIGYAGVTGALAGMNEKGISLSEVGAFSAAEELDGVPWAFMARRILEEASTLEEATEIIQNAKHTLGYNYLIADGDPDHFGTPEFNPRAVSIETNFQCCEVFQADDPKEHEAVWISPDGERHFYGTPMKEATMRADTAFGKSTRALQAADDGPGDKENLGNPWGNPPGDSTYVTCHLPMRDMIHAYETGSEYVFPVRDTKVIEAGEPRRIGMEETLNIAATVAHNTERLHDNDWNVMSVAYAPTDLDFQVAYETCDENGNWLNAPDSGYFRFNLKELLQKPRKEE